MSENRLRHEASPYLLQHQDNPVHWQPWGPAALAEAAAANKPIILSIGYAACHWCHVMAHESFEDVETAEVMNRLFVNIKVDREERPDIDQIYMSALHSLGEQGGWPLTMFLTPDGKPIWGGTYFPKTSKYGRAAFTDVMTEVARIYHHEPEKVNYNTALLMEHFARQPTDTATMDEALLDRAAHRLLRLMDRDRGGVRGAPKFPQASLLNFLWRAGDRTQNPDYQNAVLTTLRNICQGGIYDHIGGGFSRYSVDDRWLVPHFEKMLYDNAQLIELLTRAWLATGEPLFKTRIEETITWLIREMRQPHGAFAASLDADSEGHEGRFYVWTRDGVLDALGPEDGAFFADAYDIIDGGNWEGVSIPNRLASQTLRSAADEQRLFQLRAVLLVLRETRPRPGLDDKILADWNGLIIAALASAGAVFRRPDWIDLAARAFAFVTDAMMAADRLAHAYRNDRKVFPGLATDYAALTRASLALHSATLDPGYLAKARELTMTLRLHHWDNVMPGYFLSADDAEALIVRPRSATDEATPSANALMAENLVRLWHLTGDDTYMRDVDDLIAASGSSVAENIFSATGILSGLDFRIRATDIVIVSPAGMSPASLVNVVRDHASPNTILAVHEEIAALPSAHPAAGKQPQQNTPTAFVCRGNTCSLPVTHPAALRELMN